VKRRPTATSLGCPFFIAVRRFSAGALFVCRDTARLDRRPCCPAPLGWNTATTSYAFRPLFASATHPFAQISKSWTATPGCLAPGRRWPVAGSRTSRLS
jgi:hypothetical protein